MEGIPWERYVHVAAASSASSEHAAAVVRSSFASANVLTAGGRPRRSRAFHKVKRIEEVVPACDRANGRYFFKGEVV